MPVADYETQCKRLIAIDEDGWLDGEGKAVDKMSVVFMSNLVRFLEGIGLPRASLYPTIDGGVRAEWMAGKVEAGIERSPDGKWSFDFLDVKTQDYVSFESPPEETGDV